MFDVQFIDRLADAVAERIAKTTPTPIEDQLWNIKRIAEHLDRSQQVVRESMACLPSFPKAIRLPSKGRAWPLYNAGEVIEWAKKFKEKN